MNTNSHDKNQEQGGASANAGLKVGASAEAEAGDVSLKVPPVPVLPYRVAYSLGVRICGPCQRNSPKQPFPPVRCLPRQTIPRSRWYVHMSRCRFWLADSLRFDGPCFWFPCTCAPLQEAKPTKDPAHSRVDYPTVAVLMECSEVELQDKLRDCALLLDGDKALTKSEKHHVSVVEGRIKKAIRRVEIQSNNERIIALQAECFMRVFPLHSRVRLACHYINSRVLRLA